MRRLALVTLLVFALAAPAALAAHRTAGDGTVAGRDVNGTVVLWAHGAVWGVVQGPGASIRATDLDGDGLGALKVSGWDLRQFLPATTYALDPTDTTGAMRFAFVSQGDYRLVLKGSDISFSAVGGGRVTLDGADTSGSTGKFQLDGNPWQPVPVISTTYIFPTGP